MRNELSHPRQLNFIFDENLFYRFQYSNMVILKTQFNNKPTYILVPILFKKYGRSKKSRNTLQANAQSGLNPFHLNTMECIYN